MTHHRAATTSTCILLLVGVLAAGLPAEADHHALIQPGARVDMPGGGWCTLNFVFTDPEGALYIGTAGHCIADQPLGTRVSTPGIGEFGSLVYVEFISEILRWMDFALFEIDADKHALVDPAMRTYGGPVDVEHAFVPGTPTFVHGHGLYFQTTEATRALRPGVLEYHKDDPNWVPTPGWFFASNPVYAGDSGGAVLTGQGNALGIVSILAITDKAPVGGPSIELILEWMAEEGWDLSLVTAPYDLQAAAMNATVGIVEHCMDNPTGDAANPDACVVV